MTPRCLIAWSVNKVIYDETTRTCQSRRFPLCLFPRSDSEVSNESCDSSRSLDWESDSSDSETRVIDGVIIPYEDEPLADCGEEVSPNENEEETDIDELTPSTLESRFEENVSVDSW